MTKIITSKGTLKIASLSERDLKKLRSKAVSMVNKSEDSVSNIAKSLSLNPSTLHLWCNADLGPSQLKWLQERGNKLRAAKACATKAAKKDPPVVHPHGHRKPVKFFDDVKKQLTPMQIPLTQRLRMDEERIIAAKRLLCTNLDNVKLDNTPGVSIMCTSQGVLLSYTVSGQCNVKVFHEAKTSK